MSSFVARPTSIAASRFVSQCAALGGNASPLDGVRVAKERVKSLPLASVLDDSEIDACAVHISQSRERRHWIDAEVTKLRISQGQRKSGRHGSASIVDPEDLAVFASFDATQASRS